MVSSRMRPTLISLALDSHMRRVFGLPYCPYCGSELKEGYAFCRTCGKKIEPSTETSVSIMPSTPTLPPPEVKRYPRVGDFEVWVPIAWLAAMLIGGYFHVGISIFVQILATIYVYYDSKHYGFGHSMWIVTLLLGVIGVALYAYRLHQLKMKQEGRIVKNGLSTRMLIALGSIALLSGCFLWQWSLATSIQKSGTVGGTTYGPLSESYEIQAVHPDTTLTVQCKSVQAVQVWISTKDEFSNWKMWGTIKLLAQDLGSDVTISVNLKTAGTYVVIIGKAAGYVVTSYNVKIATDAYPMRIQGGILFFGGAVTLAIAIVGLVRHSQLP